MTNSPLLCPLGRNSTQHIWDSIFFLALITSLQEYVCIVAKKIKIPNSLQGLHGILVSYK